MSRKNYLLIADCVAEVIAQIDRKAFRARPVHEILSDVVDIFSHKLLQDNSSFSKERFAREVLIQLHLLSCIVSDDKLVQEDK